MRTNVSFLKIDITITFFNDSELNICWKSKSWVQGTCPFNRKHSNEWIFIGTKPLVYCFDLKQIMIIIIILQHHVKRHDCTHDFAIVTILSREMSYFYLFIFVAIAALFVTMSVSRSVCMLVCQSVNAMNTMQWIQYNEYNA